MLFGCKDGSVYCLRAEDGALAWRYRASADRRHMALEQLESVWPIHGSVLVENGVVSFVAGRSVFLDGGLRFFRLDAATGKKIAEQNYDDKIQLVLGSPLMYKDVDIDHEVRYWSPSDAGLSNQGQAGKSGSKR